MLLHTLVEGLAEERTETTVGLNVVTRALEGHIDAARTSAAEPPLPRILFVCEGDVESTALTAHLPMLVASYNAVVRPSAPLLLVPLAPGAELLLSTALDVRRASVVLLSTAFPGLERLLQRVASAFGPEYVASGFRVKWLDTTAALAPPRIKHVVSSTPANLNEAKAQKKASRKAHQEKKRVQRSRGS